MGNAYSEDLRARVIRALEEGASQRATAARYEVSASTVNIWWKTYRDEGRARALPDSG
ncbi:MAG: helix-turn-helix domain-containing protein, partial [Myxococcales bacterium]|nr:helix-turn-helix domain-containing protein [Myxococcales bacterium]